MQRSSSFIFLTISSRIRNSTVFSFTIFLFTFVINKPRLRSGFLRIHQFLLVLQLWNSKFSLNRLSICSHLVEIIFTRSSYRVASGIYVSCVCIDIRALGSLLPLSDRWQLHNVCSSFLHYPRKLCGHEKWAASSPTEFFLRIRCTFYVYEQNSCALSSTDLRSPVTQAFPYNRTKFLPERHSTISGIFCP